MHPMTVNRKGEEKMRLHPGSLPDIKWGFLKLPRRNREANTWAQRQQECSWGFGIGQSKETWSSKSKDTLKWKSHKLCFHVWLRSKNQVFTPIPTKNTRKAPTFLFLVIDPEVALAQHHTNRSSPIAIDYVCNKRIEETIWMSTRCLTSRSLESKTALLTFLSLLQWINMATGRKIAGQNLHLRLHHGTETTCMEFTGRGGATREKSKKLERQGSEETCEIRTPRTSL